MRVGISIAIGALALIAAAVLTTRSRAPLNPDAAEAPAAAAPAAARGIGPTGVPPRSAVTVPLDPSEESPEAGPRIRLRAVDAITGAPLAEVQAVALPIGGADDPADDVPDAAAPGHAESLVTDDGAFSLRCDRQGLHLVQVWSSLHLPAARRVQVAPTDGSTHEIRLAPAVRLSGELRDADGAPVEGAWLQLTAMLDASGTDPADDANDAPAAVTDADGRFALPPVAAGRYALLVDAAERPSLVVHGLVLGGEDAEPFRRLTLPPPAQLEGRLAWAPPPAARVGVELRLTHENGAIRSVALDPSDGSFACEGLGAGRWRLDVRLADGSAAGWLLEQIAAARSDFDVTLASGERRAVDVADPRTRFAALTVRTPAAEAQPRLVAERLASSEYEGIAAAIEGRPDATGTTVFPALPPGTWRIRAFGSDGAETATAVVDLAAGGTGDVSLQARSR